MPACRDGGLSLTIHSYRCQALCHDACKKVPRKNITWKVYLIARAFNAWKALPTCTSAPLGSCPDFFLPQFVEWLNRNALATSFVGQVAAASLNTLEDTARSIFRAENSFKQCNDLLLTSILHAWWDAADARTVFLSALVLSARAIFFRQRQEMTLPFFTFLRLGS